MGKFKIGDKVIVTEHKDNMSNPSVYSKDVFNLIGTICDVHCTTWTDKSISYRINFEKNIDGHDCNGMCKDGHGQNVNEKYLKLYDEKKSEDKLCRKRNMKRNHWSSRLKRNTKVRETY